MINSVALTGRLTKDPELVVTQSNVKLCNITLAVNRPKKQNGEQQADFIRCIVFNAQAENLVKYQRKGSLIAVDGRIQTSSYDDKNGNRQFSTEIVARGVHYLEPQDQQGNGSGNDQQQYNNGQQSQQNRPQQPQNNNQGGSYQQAYGSGQQRPQQQYNNQPTQGEGNPFANSNPADDPGDDLPF